MRPKHPSNYIEMFLLRGIFSIMALSKLVSRIPPAPRVPRVEGVSLLAPTVSERPPTPDEPEVVQLAPSMPRWRKQQLARSREILRAASAVLAALLMGALLAWASQ